MDWSLLLPWWWVGGFEQKLFSSFVVLFVFYLTWLSSKSSVNKAEQELKESERINSYIENRKTQLMFELVEAAFFYAQDVANYDTWSRFSFIPTPTLMQRWIGEYNDDDLGFFHRNQRRAMQKRNFDDIKNDWLRRYKANNL